MRPHTLSAPASTPPQANALLGVEVRHLATLAAIAETRSFRGAAEELGYVQSAISQQLARLEKLVGVRLVERTRGHARVELTAAGRIMLGHAEQIVAQLRAAHADLAGHLAGERPALRVGMLPSVATRILPALLAQLGPELPPGSVTAVEHAEEGTLFAAVEAGELDAVFAELPLLPGAFEADELLCEECVLLVPADSPLRGADAGTIGSWGKELSLVARPGWRHGQLLAAGLEAAGLQPRYEYSSGSDAGAQALVAAGLAAAVLPRSSVDESDPRSSTVPGEGLLAPRRLVLVRLRGRDLGSPFESFLAAAEVVCGRLDWKRRAHGGPSPVRSSPEPATPLRRRSSASA